MWESIVFQTSTVYSNSNTSCQMVAVFLSFVSMNMSFVFNQVYILDQFLHLEFLIHNLIVSSLAIREHASTSENLCDCYIRFLFCFLNWCNLQWLWFCRCRSRLASDHIDPRPQTSKHHVNGKIKLSLIWKKSTFIDRRVNITHELNWLDISLFK